MESKAYNPITGEIETLTEEEVEILDALRDQFQEDVELLLAEKEICKKILKQHMLKMEKKG